MNTKLWSRRTLGALSVAGLVMGFSLRSPAVDKANASLATSATAAIPPASPSASALVREPLARAAQARRRAKDARRSGDGPHAAMLEALGREWADTAQSLIGAQETERKAADLERRAAELEAKISRARALLEETVARRGRARAGLDGISASGEFRGTHSDRKKGKR